MDVCALGKVRSQPPNGTIYESRAKRTDSETDSVEGGVSDRRGVGEGFWVFV